LSPDHRFAFHLPAGRYTLVATCGDLAGATFGVPARADQDSEVDIQLGPTAHIAGTVRAPAEAEIEVKATPVGGAPVVGSQLIENGAFTLSGLIPGRRYDLTFFGPTLRRSTLRSITAPTDALEVALVELPIVRGAIGLSDDDGCPVDTVTLHGPGIDEDDPPSSDVGDDCRFELRVPESAADPTIVATGAGWRLEDSLSLPPQGDPDPICLNPPCRSDQLDLQGTLRVRFEGAPDGSSITVESVVIGARDEGIMACASNGASCELGAVTAGRSLELTISAAGCAPVSRTVAVHAGDNLLSLACRPPPAVEYAAHEARAPRL
jgi:hypothetical protein